ncbi:hypothetical protein HN51_036430, partial [Arachis hypogaea]
SAFTYLFFSSKSPSSSSTTIASSATSSASPSTSPSPTPSPSESHARPLTKLNRPKVILNSSDGFRFSIVNDHFLDPHSGDAFYMRAIDLKGWL